MSFRDHIRHVVVLMMENRSFDHFFGFLAIPGLIRLNGDETNRDRAGFDVRVSDTASPALQWDPSHAHVDVMAQMFGNNLPTGTPYIATQDGYAANFDKFSNNNGAHIMRCFNPADLPVIATLASSYAVCDQWFCSLPGETWPNRNYANAGTSEGEVDIKYHFYHAPTIFERLVQAGCDYRIYHDSFAQTWVYPKLWMASDLRRRFRDFKEFADDVDADTLPDYAFIEPHHLGKDANSQHPADRDTDGRRFLRGEQLIADVYMKLRSRPEVFGKTLLVITYDEHGGFYDHANVPPQATPPGDKVSTGAFPFDCYGPRVPTVLVSPWITAGTVDHTVYDHTSIIRSLRELFPTIGGPLTARDGAAQDFWGNVTETLRPPDSWPSVTPKEPEPIREAIEMQPGEGRSDRDAYYYLGQRVKGILQAQRDGRDEDVLSLLQWGGDPAETLKTAMVQPAIADLVLEKAPGGVAAKAPPLHTAEEVDAIGRDVAAMMHE